MHVARLGGRLGVSLICSPPRLSRRTVLSALFAPAFQKPAACLTLSAPTVNRNAGLPKVRRVACRRYTSNETRMDRNGNARHKRKRSPVEDHDRPLKLFKPEHPESINGTRSPDSQYSYDTDSIADVMTKTAKATGDTAEWQATIEEVVRNVVSIHFCQTCSFDTSPAISSEATGFVVDAEKGYILTNRHVVGAGPFWGYCIFDNHEEVNCSFYASSKDQANFEPPV